MPIGVQFTSRSQLPGGGGHVPADAPTAPATPAARSRIRARGPSTPRRATPARRPRPAPIRRRRASRLAVPAARTPRSSSGWRKPARRCCVRPASAVMRIVLSAPIRRVASSTSSTRSSSGTLNGIVTLAPFSRARARTPRSRRDRRPAAADTRRRGPAARTPRCASPARPSARSAIPTSRRRRSTALIERNRKSSRSDCALSWPTSFTAPA